MRSLYYLDLPFRSGTPFRWIPSPLSLPLSCERPQGWSPWALSRSGRITPMMYSGPSLNFSRQPLQPCSVQDHRAPERHLLTTGHHLTALWKMRSGLFLFGVGSISTGGQQRRVRPHCASSLSPSPNLHPRSVRRASGCQLWRGAPGQPTLDQVCSSPPVLRLGQFSQGPLWLLCRVCLLLFPPLLGGLGFPGGSDNKASAHNEGDLGSITGSGRSLGEGNGNPRQYSCLENSVDGGAWWATVHEVAKSQTLLSDFTFFSLFPPLLVNQAQTLIGSPSETTFSQGQILKS